MIFCPPHMTTCVRFDTKLRGGAASVMCAVGITISCDMYSATCETHWMRPNDAVNSWTRMLDGELVIIRGAIGETGVDILRAIDRYYLNSEDDILSLRVPLATFERGIREMLSTLKAKVAAATVIESGDAVESGGAVESCDPPPAAAAAVPAPVPDARMLSSKATPFGVLPSDAGGAIY